MPSKPNISQKPKVPTGPFDLMGQKADISLCETRDSSGNPKSIFVVNESFNVHLDLEYPEVLADVKAAYTVRLICIQLAPSFGTGPYSTVFTGNLDVNTTNLSLDFPFTASDPGMGPGIYFVLATLDFGSASQFAAYCLGNVFFVAYP